MLRRQKSAFGFRGSAEGLGLLVTLSLRYRGALTHFLLNRSKPLHCFGIGIVEVIGNEAHLNPADKFQFILADLN